MTSYITDWSNHNSGSLTQPQADGLIGFWHKITDGDHWYEDPYCRSHCDMARSRGVDTLGLYHVLWGNRDLRSQAQWFVDRARALVPDFRVLMSDNEPFGYNVAPTIAQCNEFNRLVAEIAGIPSSSVFAYNPQWYYGSAISGLKYPWVQSNYGSNPAGPYASVYQNTVGDQSSRWHGPAPIPVLQYGSNTDVGDANAFRGTLADFLAFIGQGSTSPTPRSADVYFFSDANQSQFVADSNFERYWAFRGGDGVWDTLYAVAGKPPTINTTAAQRSSGMFGKYMGVYQDSMPREPQPCEDGGTVPPITVAGTLSGTLSGSVSGSVSGTVTGSVSGTLESTD